MKGIGASQKSVGSAQSSAGGDEKEDDETEVDDDINGESLGDGELKYSTRNNLVVLDLSPGAKIYLRNKGFWDSLNIDLSGAGPAVLIDSAVLTIWPPAASARRSLLAREFVGYLGNLIGREKVHELQIWADASTVSKDTALAQPVA
ncbi:MAG: hypothetical protein WCF85_21360 [Rhodospirillaceae bacterium]